MRSAYIEDKDYRGLLSSFDLKFGRRVLRVFIWKTVASLRKNTYFPKGKQLGAYVHYPMRGKTGLFGEIHLVKAWIGAGYVAHEVQHFMLDWLLWEMSHGYKSRSMTYQEFMNEKMAYLAGDITREIWNEYYKILRQNKKRVGKKARAGR